MLAGCKIFETSEASRDIFDTDDAQENANNDPESSKKREILENRERSYTKDDIQLAYEAVQDGMSVHKACKMYKIPRGTLKYRLKKNIDNQKEVRTGPKCYLSRDEELPIVERLHGMADAGFTISYRLVRTFAGEYVKANCTNNPFSNGLPSTSWSARVFKQYPELEIRAGENWACYGKEAIPKEPVATWFSCATRYLEKMDGMAVLQNRLQVFSVDYVQLQNKYKCLVPTSCLFGANAYGNLLPPLVLYPQGNRLPSAKEQSKLNYSVAHQDTETTAGNALYQWLSEVFQPWLIERNVPRPVILFVDGHRLQMGYQSSEFCKQHQIIFVSLLPRSIHMERPLNAKLFDRINHLWWEERKNASKNKSIHADQLLHSILNQIEDTENIIREGFYQSQIFPWNPDGHSVPFTPVPVILNKRKPAKPRPRKPQIELTPLPPIPPTTIPENPKTTNPPSPKPVDPKLIRYRRMFESRLPAQQLARFQEQRYCGDNWQGPVEETCLFRVWRDLQDEIDGVESAMPQETDNHMEEEGLCFETVTVKLEDPDDLMLDFVKEEPTDDGEL